MNGPELRDIHLPADSLWWPPAPGWWLLLGLAVAVLAGLLWWRRHRRNPSLSRLSMRELSRIRQLYRDGQVDRRAALDSVARLLRRVAINYRGRPAAAASTGEGWLAQLEELAPGHGFSDEHRQWLTDGRYRPHAACDVDALLAACEAWMQSLPRKA